MKTGMWFFYSLVISVAFAVWLSPPWYGSFAMSSVIGMLVKIWADAWWRE